MKAYLTVGEMGRMFGLNVQTLHYYDKIGLFCPQLRNPETVIKCTFNSLFSKIIHTFRAIHLVRKLFVATL